MGSYEGTDRIDCCVCGVAFNAEGQWREYPGDSRFFVPEDDRCAACLEYGARDLPDSPCCGGRLQGWPADDDLLHCQECDRGFPPANVRTYLLGQLVERLCKESRTGSAEEVGRMILAAGRTSLRRVQ